MTTSITFCRIFWIIHDEKFSLTLCCCCLMRVKKKRKTKNQWTEKKYFCSHNQQQSRLLVTRPRKNSLLKRENVCDNELKSKNRKSIRVSSDDAATTKFEVWENCFSRLAMKCEISYRICVSFLAPCRPFNNNAHPFLFNFYYCLAKWMSKTEAFCCRWIRLLPLHGVSCGDDRHLLSRKNGQWKTRMKMTNYQSKEHCPTFFDDSITLWINIKFDTLWYHVGSFFFGESTHSRIQLCTQAGANRSLEKNYRNYVDVFTSLIYRERSQ